MIVLCFIIFALILVATFFTVLYKIYCQTFRLDPDRGTSVAGKSRRYDKYIDVIKANMEAVEAVGFEEVEITSKDNYRLSAKLYYCFPDAPIAMFFHGYRSFAGFDGSFLFRIFYNRGINVLMVNQRAHGRSKVKSITFGVRESDDCLLWADFLARRYGKDTKLILSGMSMGASTVLMASNKKFTADVRGIIADCGFYSPGQALRFVIEAKGYNVGLIYPLVKLSAILFAGFNPDKHTTGDALAQSDIPVIIIHGDKDRFVPYEMGLDNFNAVRAEKKLVTVHGAGHAVSCYVNSTLYENEVNKFMDKIL